MSATRDKSQKFTFVYSNLYQLYKNGKKPPQAAMGPESGKVLKADDLRSKQAFSAVRVGRFQPTEFLGKRIVSKPAAIKTYEQVQGVLQNSSQSSQMEALHGLKQNLDTLNQLHSRLRFMLQELEELVKLP
jgi:hypothetical protein